MYIQYAPFLAHQGFFYFSTQLSEDTFIELKLKDEDESYIINTNHVIYAVSNRDFD